MRIEIGDLLSVTNGIIVHGCNAQGKMGSGIAKSIREKYPGAYDLYSKDVCQVGVGNPELLGTVSLWSNATESEINLDSDLVIANAITQLNYGKDGRKYVSYAAVKAAFSNLAILCEVLNAKSINFPMIGAGLGGGDWSIISGIIENCFASSKTELVLWVLD